jgi:hypothetical protein
MIAAVLVPVLVSVVVNIVTALFSRKHGLKVLRISLFFLEHFLFYCRPFRASLNQA